MSLEITRATQAGGGVGEGERRNGGRKEPADRRQKEGLGRNFCRNPSVCAWEERMYLVIY